LETVIRRFLLYTTFQKEQLLQLFFGTKDKYVPVETAKLYQAKMEAVGSRCDLFIYQDQQHGFFNYKPAGDKTYFLKTMYETDVFLESLGIINGKPAIDQYKFE